MKPDFTLRFYTGEEPQVGDTVRLGGSEPAVEWEVDFVTLNLMTIRRPKAIRRGVYVCRYALVRRRATPEAAR